MNKKFAMVITGLVIWTGSVISTIHSMNIHAQAIIDWANDGDAYSSYNSGYALAGTEFAFLGIVLFFIGGLVLATGLFRTNKW
jgi:hypothetical protein